MQQVNTTSSLHRQTWRCEGNLLAGLLAAVVLTGLVSPRLPAEARGSLPSAAEQQANKHWAYVKPERPAVPEVEETSWVRNAIDRFILARLEEEGLSPSPQAEKTRLIRRVTLDLTGLPPTPAEVDAFLADDSANAYEKVVDRLLQSSRYGERMAARWLDAARYADTNGYQTDGQRHMWRWRDWVIGAYNENMPFDRFTVEQIAGDLLPDATRRQILATGFNRNHRGNGEGGIIPEEFRVEYVVDRVETTSTVWLGLTMGCARCHDHKYDPITQKEFYEFFAFFNNVPERGNPFKFGNSPPLIKAPTEEQQNRLATIEEELAAAQKRFRQMKSKIRRRQAEWEQSLLAEEPINWRFSKHLLARFGLNGNSQSEEVTFQDGKGDYAPGKLASAARFDSRKFLNAGDVGKFGYLDQFSLSAWIKPKRQQVGTILSRMKDVDRGSGYSLRLAESKLQLNLVKRWLDDSLRLETRKSLPAGQWSHVLITYDGSRLAKGVRMYINGKQQKLKVNLDSLNQEFATSEPLRIAAGGGPEKRFRGLIDEVCLYDEVLTPQEVQIVATPDSIHQLAAIPPEERTAGQSGKLRRCFLTQAAEKPIRRAWNKLTTLRDKREQRVESFPTVMVMQEMEQPRETHVLERGQYDKPGEDVRPGIPDSLPSLPDGVPRNRLGLARWLVDPSNPLTARVAVNRYWEMYFGTGLVKTLEDFGTQGDRPSHPKLLDWLATEFIRTGWDVKRMQKLIVMSATYRQRSQASPGLLQRDPQNRLLARGPRERLSAEMIRDQALFASGLLNEKIGGPSVKPYQPEGLWKSVSGHVYKQDHGDDLYRRSLYTFWKRTVPHPEMANFDAPSRETCRVREPRTNTPLQALALMNDVTFVEASRKLAERMIRQGGSTLADRLTFGFRLVTARRPKPEELDVLADGYRHHLDKYRNNPEEARKLLKTGESSWDKDLDADRLAAYTTLASLMLNLDETITKE